MGSIQIRVIADRQMSPCDWTEQRTFFQEIIGHRKANLACANSANRALELALGGYRSLFWQVQPLYFQLTDISRPDRRHEWSRHRRDSCRISSAVPFHADHHGFKVIVSSLMNLRVHGYSSRLWIVVEYKDAKAAARRQAKRYNVVERMLHSRSC